MRPRTSKARNAKGVATSVTAKMPMRTQSLSMPANTTTARMACSTANITQLIGRLPSVSVVMPTIAHELMPVKAATYGVRPVTRMLIRSASGIRVGQRRRSEWPSLGISSGVRPRRPLRLASKCTCMNTP